MISNCSPNNQRNPVGGQSQRAAVAAVCGCTGSLSSLTKCLLVITDVTGFSFKSQAQYGSFRFFVRKEALQAGLLALEPSSGGTGGTSPLSGIPALTLGCRQPAGPSGLCGAVTSPGSCPNCIPGFGFLPSMCSAWCLPDIIPHTVPHTCCLARPSPDVRPVCIASPAPRTPRHTDALSRRPLMAQVPHGPNSSVQHLLGLPGQLRGCRLLADLGFLPPHPAESTFRKRR